MPTNVSRYRSKKQAKVAFVMIPGNPGSTGFYEPFAAEVFEALGRRVDTMVVSHSNHHSSDVPRLFSLEEQINHKLDFIEELLEKEPGLKIILAGHSVGAYICAQLLRSLPADRVLGCYFLFPTLMHIARSKNGQRLSPLLKHGRWIAGAVVGALSCLPHSWKRRAAAMHLGSGSHFIDTGSPLAAHPEAKCVLVSSVALQHMVQHDTA